MLSHIYISGHRVLVGHVITETKLTFLVTSSPVCFPLSTTIQALRLSPTQKAAALGYSEPQKDSYESTGGERSAKSLGARDGTD